MAIVAVATSIMFVSGCGSSDSGSSSGADVPKENFIDETGKDTVTIDAVDNNFKGQYVDVSPGTEVVFVNDGHNTHNVIPVNDGEFKAIETSEFDPGDKKDRTFDEPGYYPYYCSLHGTPTKGMIGGIRVVKE